MKKLKAIQQICEDAIEEYRELLKDSNTEELQLEYGRADLAEEILEILNGEEK